jgi:hypothetical protein
MIKYQQTNEKILTTLQQKGQKTTDPPKKKIPRKTLHQEQKY